RLGLRPRERARVELHDLRRLRGRGHLPRVRPARLTAHALFWVLARTSEDPMRSRLLLTAVLSLFLAAGPVPAAEARLTAEQTLRAAPEQGAVLGLLTTGAPVTEVERQGDWVKIRVEGWIRGSALAQATPPASTPAAAPTVQALPAVAATRAPSLEG